MPRHLSNLTRPAFTSMKADLLKPALSVVVPVVALTMTACGGGDSGTAASNVVSAARVTPDTVAVASPAAQASAPTAGHDAGQQASAGETVDDGLPTVSMKTVSGRSVDRKRFFDGVRANFGRLNQSQVDGINSLLANMEADREPAIGALSVWKNQIAYTFATAKHEVANTYQPITEYSNTACRNYDGGCTYKGRGYVQLTHRYNYRKMSPIVGVDLVAYPQRALEPNIAYRVMSYGMHHGSFTGRKLGSYIYAGHTDYVNARRVVNGTDRAQLIAGYARKFQSVLNSSAR